MGEIGYNRLEFLYELHFWEIALIIRGYNRRQRDLWSASRWSTYNVMLAQIGSNGMRDAGIRKPTDLIKFPWEKEKAELPTEDEMDDIRRDIEAFKKKRSKQ